MTSLKLSHRMETKVRAAARRLGCSPDRMLFHMVSHWFQLDAEEERYRAPGVSAPKAPRKKRRRTKE